MAMSERRRTVRQFLLPAFIVLGSILTAGAWVVSSPSGGGPDDVTHEASIWCPRLVNHSCPVLGYSNADPLQPNKPIVQIPKRIVQASCFAFKPSQSAACLYDVPADSVIGSADADSGRYPGVYYAVMHVFASSSPANLDRMVLMVRAANALIAALFFSALAWLLPWTMKRLLVYVMVGLSVPLVIYFLTSVNPTAWGIIGVVSAWFALTGLFATAAVGGVEPWRRRALAALAVAAAALAASARTDCAAFCFVVVLAVGAFHLPQLHPRRWRSLRLVWAAMIAVAVIGIVGTFSGSQTTGLMGLSGGTHANTGGHILLMYNIEHLPDLFQGFWNGALGWFDVPMLPITTGLVTLIGFGLIYLGLRRMSLPKAIAAGGVTLVMVVLALFTYQMGIDRVGQNVQPRYFAPLILVVVGILLSRRRHDGARPLSLTQTWVAYCCLVVAQSFALHEVIKRYVMGQDDMTQNLNRAVQWWRAWLPSPMVVWVLGSVGFAALALLLFIVRKARPVEPLAGPGLTSDEEATLRADPDTEAAELVTQSNAEAFAERSA